MKKIVRFGIMSIFFCTAVFAGERDDLRYLDELYQQKKYEIAASESENFLATYPNSRRYQSVQERLGKTYFSLKDYSKALPHLVSAALNSKAKNKDELYYYVARCYAIEGKVQESDNYISMLDTKEQYYTNALYDTGVTYLSQEKYDQAQKKFDAVIASDNFRKNDAILSMALLHFNKKDYKAAQTYLAQYPQVEKSNGNYTIVNFLYGSIYSGLGDSTRAISYFQNVISKDVKSNYGKRSLENLVRLYAQTGDNAKAVEYLGWIENAKDRVSLLTSIGDTYASQEAYKDAIEYYRMSDLNDLQTLYGLGYSYYKLGQYTEALKYLNKLKNTSYEERALYSLFYSNYRSKNYSQVVQNRALVDKYKLSDQDKYNLEEIVAASAYETGNYAISYTYYNKIYQKSPTKDNLYKTFVAATKEGNMTRIKSLFDRYNKNFASDTVYREKIYLAMGDAYYKNNEQDKGIKIYQDIVKTSKDEDTKKNLLAMLLNNQKYTELLSALANAPETTEYMYLKGIAYMGTAQYENAQQFFDKVLAASDATSEQRENAKYNTVKNYFLSSNYDETINHGQQYLSMQGIKEKDDVIDKMAISYFRLGKYNESRQMYQTLLASAGHADYIYFQIGENYYYEGNYKEARDYYMKAYTTAPTGTFAEQSYYWYLNSLLKLGDMAKFADGKEEFTSKFSKSKLIDNLLVMTGTAYEDLDKADSALESYEELYKRSSNEVTKAIAAEKIVDILIKTKKYQKVTDFTSGIQDINERSYYLSKLLVAQKNNEEAKRVLERLVNNEKYGDYASLNLGKIAYDAKDYIGAREHYQRIMDKDNSNYRDEVLFRMAVLEEDRGNLDEAYRLYTRCYVMYKTGDYANTARKKSAELEKKIKK